MSIRIKKFKAVDKGEVDADEQDKEAVEESKKKIFRHYGVSDGKNRWRERSARVESSERQCILPGGG